MSEATPHAQSVLGDMQPSKAIVKLAVPATLALLAKAVYNIVDTAYIGMLRSDIALTAVGVTIPLLLIMVSIENIFAAGAAVLAGRQLGAKDDAGASRTVTTVIVLSVMIGVALCVWAVFSLWNRCCVPSELLMRLCPLLRTTPFGCLSRLWPICLPRA